MFDPNRLSELIYLIYATVENGASGWQTLLDHIFKEVHAHMGSVMYFVDGRLESALLMGCGERAQQNYRDYYIGKDPWLPVASGYRPPNGAGLEASHELVPDSTLHKTEFYQDFARQVGYGYGFGFGIESGDGVTAAISAARDVRSFTEDEFRQLRLLEPHIRQALRLARAFGRAELEREMLLGTAERLHQGLVFSDGRGHVVVANRAAETISNAADGISFSGGTLRAVSPKETNAMRALIAAVVDQNAAGGVILISRTAGRRPWVVNVSACRTTHRPLARILITDPKREPEHDGAAIGRAYGLTPAETRIALRLARGERVKSIAEELEISVNTARTHVKRILSKASVRSQSQLIVLLSPLRVH